MPRFNFIFNVKQLKTNKTNAYEQFNPDSKEQL